MITSSWCRTTTDRERRKCNGSGCRMLYCFWVPLHVAEVFGSPRRVWEEGVVALSNNHAKMELLLAAVKLFGFCFPPQGNRSDANLSRKAADLQSSVLFVFVWYSTPNRSAVSRHESRVWPVGPAKLGKVPVAYASLQYALFLQPLVCMSHILDGDIKIFPARQSQVPKCKSTFCLRHET